jgi:hypothetical protein
MMQDDHAIPEPSGFTARFITARWSLAQVDGRDVGKRHA